MHTHLLSWPEGLPMPPHWPAGSSRRASGQGFWEHSPVPEDPGQERMTRARAHSKASGSLDSDSGASRPGENGPAGSPCLSCQSGWPRPCGSALLDSAGEQSLQPVVFRCSCAMRVTDHREERNHRASSGCAQGLPCAVLLAKDFLLAPFSPTPIKKKGRDQVLGISWMIISI